MARRDLVELGEHRLLDLHPLRHGLDHEVDVAEAVVVGRAGDQPELALELVDAARACRHRRAPATAIAAFSRPGVDELLLDVLEHDRDVGVGDHMRDLAAHRAGADHGGLEDEQFWILGSEVTGSALSEARGAV